MCIRDRLIAVRTGDLQHLRMHFADLILFRAETAGEQFGLGDIAVAPFVYNLLSILDSWQPRPHLQRWYCLLYTSRCV